MAEIKNSNCCDRNDKKVRSDAAANFAAEICPKACPSDKDKCK